MTPLKSFVGRFLLNILSSVRAAFFLKVSSGNYSVSWAHWLALVAGNVLAPTLASLWVIGRDGEFSSSRLPDAVYPSLIVLVVACAASHLAGRRERVLLLAVSMSGLLLAMTGLVLLLGVALDESPLGHRLWTRYNDWWVVWFAATASAAMVRLLQPSRRRIDWLVSLMSAATLVLTLQFVWYDSSMWNTRYDDSAESDRARLQSLASEAVLYAQPPLLEAALAALKSQRPGVTDLYFVGVAGYASQDVFMKEVSYVQALFDRRFDTSGRSMTLVNNPATATEKPFANTISLERSLNHLGRLIDRQQDIVFLFLTSHGSREQGFSLDAWPLRFDPLSPQRLRAMLDQAGIQNRVIVVSACYSGIFVDALKDDHTMIITAAASDRTSFGCSHENDFTYFGDAYFAQALREGNSFTDAFAVARDIVTRREHDEDLTASMPQMAAGDAIRQRLADWQARRAQPGSAAQ